MITIESIKAAVAAHYGLAPDEFDGQCRKRFIAWPRQMAMSLSLILTDHSQVRIGQLFGKRDHSTVIHARRSIQQRCRECDDTRRVMLALLRQILHQDRAWL